MNYSTLKSFSRAALLGVLFVGLSGCADTAINRTESARREGVAHYNAQNYGDAAGAFRNAVRHDPRDYHARYQLALSYEAMGKHQEAIQSYKATLDVMQRSMAGREDAAFRVQVMEGLASAISKSGNRNAEIDVIEQQARASQTAEDYFLLAKIHRAVGDLDSAFDAYNRAWLADSRNFELTKEIGLFMEQIGQAQQAEQMLRRAYVLERNDDQVNAALRRLGIIPGPSLLDERDLSRPLVRGPFPDVDWDRAVGRQNKSATDQPDEAPIPSETVRIPQD